MTQMCSTDRLHSSTWMNNNVGADQFLGPKRWPAVVDTLRLLWGGAAITYETAAMLQGGNAPTHPVNGLTAPQTAEYHTASHKM